MIGLKWGSKKAWNARENRQLEALTNPPGMGVDGGRIEGPAGVQAMEHSQLEALANPPGMGEDGGRIEGPVQLGFWPGDSVKRRL